MSALLGHLLRRQRLLLVAVALFLFVVEGVFVHVLESFEAQGGLGGLVGSLPGWIEDLLRSQLGELSSRYSLGAFFRDPALLVPALALVLLAAAQLAADRESGLADLYLARPISRARFLGTHVLAMLVPALLLPAAVLAGLGAGLATASIANAPPLVVYAGAAAGLVPLLLFFGSLALWLATGAARRGGVVTQVVAVAVLAFLLDTLGRLWAPIAPVRCFSPFFWFDPVGVLDAWTGREDAPALAVDGGALGGEPLIAQQGPLVNAAVLLAASALLTALAYRRFLRRDL